MTNAEKPDLVCLGVRGSARIQLRPSPNRGVELTVTPRRKHPEVTHAARMSQASVRALILGLLRFLDDAVVDAPMRGKVSP